MCSVYIHSAFKNLYLGGMYMVVNKQINDPNLQFVDISRWQDPYKDDGIDEGVRVDGVVIKSADGLRDYTKVGSWEYVNYWKVQWDSITKFARKWMYHWYQTEYGATAQAELAVNICKKFAGQIDAYVVDFEYYMNIIDAVSIRELERFTDWFRLNSDTKLILYLNESAYKMIVVELGQEWADEQEWWFAGGMYYNADLSFFPTPEYFENVFNYPGRVAIQWSADGNRQADEHDFGTSEAASIDMNYVYFTPEEYDAWIGKVHIPTDEEDEVVIETGNGAGGGKIEVDQAFLEAALAKVSEVNLHIHVGSSVSIPGVVTPPVDDSGKATHISYPNSILVTVQHPEKAHALLGTWAVKNAKGFPIFTAFPTDLDAHRDLRIRIANGIDLLVDDTPVKGDSDVYGLKIIDWDGYFAGLEALGNGGVPLDPDKIYIRRDWCVNKTS